MKRKVLGTLVVPFLLTVACNKSPAPEATPAETAPVAQVVTEPVKETVTETHEAQVVDLEKGKRLYMSNCISCHNKDPNLKGNIGPQMVDAPIEVMTAKIMTGRYPDPLPAGFVPKRKTKAMLKIVKLKDDIPSIYAWVQSQKK